MRTASSAEGRGQVVAGTDVQAVGVLGAGRMGLPIIRHLARAGFHVPVYDPDVHRQQLVTEAAGVPVLSPHDLATSCQLALICVGYENDLRSLTMAEEGILRDMSEGSLLAVLSTVSPEVMREILAAASVRGISVVDAPVCRGGWAADSGTLLSFVGGDESAFKRFEPVASIYSSDVVWTGGIGSGQVSKTANNLILWACLVADHEALALAQAYGVDTQMLRGALGTSSAANHALENWGKQSMAWADDDMKIVSDMAARVMLGLPQAAINREICRVLKPRRYNIEDYGR